MRAAICVVLSLLAAVATAAAAVLALTGVVVADPDRPGRLGALALASPGLREDATAYLVDGLREQGLAAGADDAQVRAATEQAVRDPRVREAFADAEITEDGDLRLGDVYDAVAARLEERGRTAEARRLRQLPDTPPGSEGLASSLSEVATTARTVLLTAAGVVGVGALVLLGLALLAARRRLLCLGGTLLAAGVVLAVGLEVLPVLAGPEGVDGSEWLSAARGLDEALGRPGTVTAVAVTVVGAVLALLGLRSRRTVDPAAAPA